MMRHVRGKMNPVLAAVDADTVIEVGDLVYQDVDDAKPASTLTADWARERAGVRHLDIGVDLQHAFADYFLGVAIDGSRKGETDPIRVATTGVFEFDCPSGTFELGDLVAPKVSDSHGPALWNQKITKVGSSKCAIARVAKRVPAAATGVLVDIRSTVMTGGVLVRCEYGGNS